jgi:lipopolysaccharide/colanic/teichoic acid biosynthesis glycosyltransferase
VALLVRWRLGAPMIFRQSRPGLRGKPFTIFKFRTMADPRDSECNLLSDAERLTAFSRLLRSTSLDELPELLNVIRGEMSLVGPRPLLMRYYPYYTNRERIRFQVRPGITGWAQVHGRSTVPWDERLAYDVWYVENLSLILDLRILLMTIGRVLFRKDITADPASERLQHDLDVERSMIGASREDR